MIGYIIGRIKIKGIEVGDAGILIVSLIAGHFGVTCPSFAKSIGIVLFVASVGLIAGPKFFHNFMHNFKSYVILGFCIIIAGGLCTAAICVIGNVNGALACRTAFRCPDKYTRICSSTGGSRQRKGYCISRLWNCLPIWCYWSRIVCAADAKKS